MIRMSMPGNSCAAVSAERTVPLILADGATTITLWLSSLAFWKKG